METQFSLMLYKPETFKRELEDQITAMITEAGFKIIQTKEIESVTLGAIKAHYREHLGEVFFPWLVDQFLEKHIRVLIIEGDIDLLLKLVGNTDPSKAEPTTIRGRFSSDSLILSQQEKRAIPNLVHCSKLKDVVEEIGMWFTTPELLARVKVWMRSNCKH